MLEIWETKVKKENSSEFPIVIPLVIYHGSDEWNVKTSFGEMIKGYAEHLVKLEDQQTGIEYFETFLRYILSASQKLTKEDVEDIIRKVETKYPEGSEVVVTLAEVLRQEGRQEGIQEGIQKGRQEEKKETLSKTAIKLLTKRFGKLPEDMRNKMSQSELENLEIIIESIFDFESLEDVKKYI